MNLGGPVWHVSIGWHVGGPLWKHLEAVARQELQGVGDAEAGEWLERGGRALHLRRRLTPKEMKEAGLEGVIDVRGTDEFSRRIGRIRPYLPSMLAEVPDEALP